MKTLIICGVADSKHDKVVVEKVQKMMINHKLLDESIELHFDKVFTWGSDNPVNEKMRWVKKENNFYGKFGDDTEKDLLERVKNKGPYDIIIFSHCPIYSRNDMFENLEYIKILFNSLLTKNGWVVFSPGPRAEYNKFTHLLKSDGYFKTFSKNQDRNNLNIDLFLQQFMTFYGDIDNSRNYFRIYRNGNHNVIGMMKKHNKIDPEPRRNKSIIYDLDKQNRMEKNPGLQMIIFEKLYEKSIPFMLKINVNDDIQARYNFYQKSYVKNFVIYKAIVLMNMSCALLRPHIFANHLNSFQDEPIFMDIKLLDANLLKYKLTINSEYVQKYMISVDVNDITDRINVKYKFIFDKTGPILFSLRIKYTKILKFKIEKIVNNIIKTHPIKFDEGFDDKDKDKFYYIFETNIIPNGYILSLLIKTIIEDNIYHNALLTNGILEPETNDLIYDSISLNYFN
tara:strand:- start:37447 stop:38808 length:1362 start_codon:yes stop_codon:yes gene_type:complete